MVFLRYLTCIVAAVAVISYTVHLERNTPIVLKVKTALGLDTTNLEAVRSGENKPSVLQSALAMVSSNGDIPKMGDLFTASKNSLEDELPAPLNGWMREDREITLEEIGRFEASFQGNANTPSGTSVSELEATASELAGAFYYRENMRMLISVSQSNNAMAKNMEAISPALQLDSAPNASIDWNGRKLPYEHNKKTGLKKVSIRTNDGLAVQIQGNVPVSTLKEYLQNFSPVL